MSDHYEGFDEDMDALHVLPLSIIPLQTEGLKRARLVKNSQLDGVVELFSGQATGAGHIAPADLVTVFADLKNEKRADLEIIKNLSALASYDVYSLRRELRSLGIAVDDHASLKLSEGKVKELAVYMRMFTRPLIAAVYGSEQNQVDSFADLLELFTRPDFKQARINLKNICKKIGIDLATLPRFLADYGDVYLSLAFYRFCLDENMPRISAFLEALPEIKESRQMRENRGLLQACALIESKLRNSVTQIAGVIETFRVDTEDMWENLNGDRFRETQRLIGNYQTAIGGGLCAIHVKMNLWSDTFPRSDAGSLTKRADFIMTHMRQGVEKIEEIKYEELRRGRARASA